MISTMTAPKYVILLHDGPFDGKSVTVTGKENDRDVAEHLNVTGGACPEGARVRARYAHSDNCNIRATEGSSHDYRFIEELLTEDYVDGVNLQL